MRRFVLGLTALSLGVPASLMVPTGAAEARRHHYDRYDRDRYDRDRDYRGREWRGRDGRYYCKKSNGTTGLIVGGVGGALLGRTIDTSGDRTLGTLGGAAVGALAGRAIDRGGSERRCR